MPVSEKISDRETMMDGDLARYLAVGAEFSAREFNATRLASTPDFNAIDFGRGFDLIWVGSLITHPDAQASRNFLAFVARHLNDGGSAIVTSHGAFVAGRLSLAQRALYGLAMHEEAAILAEYQRTGYGYCQYPGQEGYGISLASRRWMHGAALEAGLVVASHEDHAWDNHQDVVVLRRSPNA